MTYRYKAYSSSLALLATLALGGCTGPAGPPGATGAKGADGANGTNGTDGAKGTNGSNGSNGTNGTNGTNGAAAPTPYAHTFTVSAGADQAANGAALLATLAAIPTNVADARYLVQLPAGVFDVADKRVLTPPSVDLVGAGEAATRIVGYSQVVADLTVSGCVLAPGAVVRQLTVENQGTIDKALACAILVAPKARVTLDHVTAKSEIAAATGTSVAIEIASASASFSDVTILASAPSGLTAYGISSELSAVTAHDLRVQTWCIPGAGPYCSGIGMANGSLELQSSSITVKGGDSAPGASRAVYLGPSSTVTFIDVDATDEDATGAAIFVREGGSDQPVVAKLEQVTLTGGAYSLVADGMPGTSVDIVDSQLVGPLGNLNSASATFSCVNSLGGTTLLGANCL